MAKFTKEEFISGLKEMTILEVKELVDAMKEEFRSRSKCSSSCGSNSSRCS